ncbi:MAG: beta-galactosidase, partial [Kiritimatiellae bacterium]|nr:beta-galactosidase [Kiritimatiellia bacterium]
MKRTLAIAAALAATNCLASAPTGREWEDETALHSGKERPRAAFASFESIEAAKAIRPEFCSRRMLLDSETEWRFHWCRKPEERPVDFYRPDYDVSGWDVVKVPCSWQAMGINAERRPYDRPYYLNQDWPFVPKFPANSNCWPRVRGHKLPPHFTLRNDENPVGSYRRDFVIPEDWAGDEIYLEFGAVDSFFYLWVNGEYVGFSKSSRDPACFNVTKFARTGRNTVALEVYRFSDGSYLEAQDMFLLSGLARSVWAYHVPKTHIRDVQFTTSPVRKGEYGGDWRLDLKTDVVGERPGAVAVDVFDAKGRPVAYSGAAGAKSSLVFEKPRLWSAEEPNLYTLVVSLRDAAGATTEALGFQLGFREVEIRDAAKECDRTFLFNGKPIKMRGANRHETSPLYGHYTPDELIEQDVRMLKQANCNHVRNSHYPQPDYFYYLCNKYGIYVMDEANVESHGLHYGKESISHFKSWEAAHVDRVMNMVERNKCHPCIVIWSLGNEAGPGDNFRACTAAIKARDLSRPVQYERNNWLTDMGSRQYPQVEWVWKCAAGGEGLSHTPPDRPLRYPFHINEYAH